MTKLGTFLVKRSRHITVVSLALLAAYFALVTLGLGGDRQTQGNIAQCISPIAAAIACLATAGRHPPKVRWGWRLLGLSAASWGIGQLIWTWYELFGHDNVPFPSWADAGYLGAVPLGIAALITFINTPSGRVAWVRAALEGGVIATGLLFVGWALVLGPVYRSGGDTVLAQVISLAYPLGDVVISSLVLYAACRARPEARATLGLVGCALVLLAFADSSFAILTVHNAYQTGSPTDLGWTGGYLLIGLASLRVKSDDTHQENARTGHLVRTTSFAPYIPCTVALTLIVTGVIDPRHDALLWWTGVATMLLLGGLQLATLADNARLTAHLEARVAERTQDLRRRERFFRSIVQNSSEVVTVIDRDLNVMYHTSSASALLGSDGDELVGCNVLELFDVEERERIEAAIDKTQEFSRSELMIEVVCRLGSHGSQILELTVANLLNDADVEGIVVTTTDISARKALEEQLTHQAFHDSLTTLPNRALFQDRLNHALTRLQRDDAHPLAVLFIDLDGFKSVNDSLGHATGDQLLHAFAARIQQVLRPADTFARLGGDEFAVLVEESNDERQGSAVAERIARQLLEPFTVNGREIFVNASIGIANSVVTRSAEDLQRNADVAMYSAKAAGRAGYRIYEPQMHDEAMVRLDLESGLRRALERNEFLLHYQPLVELETGEIVGLEALIRWEQPDRGLIPPDRFIPIAEQTGLILPIGRWVLRQACLDAARWHDEYGDAAPRISVNLSYRQLQHADLVDEVAAILFETGLSPSQLTLELTESILADDPAKAAAKLQSIKELGVSLSIDDFGTGYSSLSYLSQFPFDELKIDRKFISALSSQSKEPALVQAILDLGKLFTLQTVAEGIETVEQRDTLREMGCQLGQGYYFSRPSPADQIGHMLSSRDQRAWMSPQRM